MSDTNVVIIEGRMVRDPEVKRTNSDLDVANFTLCSNRKYKGEEDTTFIDCVVFGKLAGIVADHRKKGDKLTVVGLLQLDRWENKQGEKRQKHTILVDKISFGVSSRGNKTEEEQEDESDEIPA